MTLGPGKIESRFGTHPGTAQTIPMHSQLRRLFKQVATELDDILPPGRAREKALTELETVSMWANKAVAELAPVQKEEHPTYESGPVETPEQKSEMTDILKSMILTRYRNRRLTDENARDFSKRLVREGLIEIQDYQAMFPGESSIE